jgi:hypothetical protein
MVEGTRMAHFLDSLR